MSAPRLVVRAVAALILAISVATLPYAASGAEQDLRSVRKVLVFSLPRATWADIGPRTTPALFELLQHSAVASMSVRSVGRDTTLGEGYASIGAGNRASVSEVDSGLALDAAERYEGDPAATVFARRTGYEPNGQVLQLGIARVIERNDRLLYGAVPGALGDALARGGRSTAVVANADGAEDLDFPVVPAFDPDLLPRHREAALAVMDEQGRVAGGSVSRDLTTRDLEGPFGVRLVESEVVSAFTAAWAEHDVVLVENSDLERADAYAIFATPEATEAVRAAALARGDRILQSLLAEVDLERDLVIVTAPAGPREREQLTVFAMAGEGVEPGFARSGTTRRAGYVTLTDIAPTILQAFDLPVPPEMVGAAITSDGDGQGNQLSDGEVREAQVEHLVRQNERAMYRDLVTGPITVAFIVFQILVYAFAAVAIATGRRGLRKAAAYLALMVLAIPIVGFASGVVPYDRLPPPAYGVGLFGAAALLAALALPLSRIHPVVAPLALLAFVLALLLVDMLSGATLQINTVFGYSPIVAGRFAGYGNLASALVAIASVLVVAGAWSLLPGGRARRTGIIGAALLFLVALVVTGLPSLGSDVGGILTLVPTAAAVLLLLAGVQLTARRVAVVGAATVVALAVFGAIDLARPAPSRTHLGRLLAATFEGGPAHFATVLQRKASANVSILTSSVWTYVIPAALAFLVFLVWRRPVGRLQHLQEQMPGLRAGLVGALVAGVVGFTLNDSGVAIPAMMFAVLLPFLTFLLVHETDAGS